MPTSMEPLLLTDFLKTKSTGLEPYALPDWYWYGEKILALQIEYYQSKEYQKMRNFNCGDNLNLQIIELQKRFGLTKEKDWLPYSCR